MFLYDSSGSDQPKYAAPGTLMNTRASQPEFSSKFLRRKKKQVGKTNPRKNKNAKHLPSEQQKREQTIRNNKTREKTRDKQTPRKETREQNNTRTKPIFRDTTETLADWKQRGISAHKIMLMGTKASADTLFPILTDTLSEQMHIYRSNDTLIELAPKSVSKLSAIQLLLSSDESLADVISFGDNYNDVEMLQHSGLGVAVANAREEVKTIANHMTLKNTEHGVAHFIKQHLI